MNTRLLKKINNRVRIVQLDDGTYKVERKHFYHVNRSYDTWCTLNTFQSLKGAIRQKHYYSIMFIFKDIGIRGEYKRRKKKRMFRDLKK